MFSIKLQDISDFLSWIGSGIYGLFVPSSHGDVDITEEEEDDRGNCTDNTNDGMMADITTMTLNATEDAAGNGTDEEIWIMYHNSTGYFPDTVLPAYNDSVYGNSTV